MFSIGGLGGISKGLGQGPNYRPSAPQVGQMGSNMPFLHQGMQGVNNLPGMLPPTNLPGSLPASLSTNLPGNLPSNLGVMRPGIGQNSILIGSQPPITGQQPLGFKPPGLTGIPGLSGLSGLPGMTGLPTGMPGMSGMPGFTGIANLPGANMPTIPGNNPLGLKPPGTTSVNPFGNMIPKPGQK